MTHHFSEHLLTQLKAHLIISTRSGLLGALHLATAILLVTSWVSVSAQETRPSSTTDISWEEIATIKAQLEQEKRHIQALRLTRQKIQFDNGTQTQIVILESNDISIEDHSYLAALERLQTEGASSEALPIPDGLQHTDINQQAQTESTQQSPFQQQIDSLIQRGTSSTAGSLQDADIQYLESLNAL